MLIISMIFCSSDFPTGPSVDGGLSDVLYRSNRPQRVEHFRDELRGVCHVAFLWRDIEHVAMSFSFDPFGMISDVEAFMSTWAGWDLRTFEGRGVNLVEGISPCLHYERNDVKNMTKTLKAGRAACKELLKKGETGSHPQIGVCEKRRKRAFFESLLGTHSQTVCKRLMRNSIADTLLS